MSRDFWIGAMALIVRTSAKYKEKFLHSAISIICAPLVRR